MSKYEAIPSQVCAEKWDGINEQDLIDLIDGGSGEVVGNVLIVKDAGGIVVAKVELNCWLVKPIYGLPTSVYTLPDEIFPRIYRK
jgi:hypothetical protein